MSPQLEAALSVWRRASWAGWRRASRCQRGCSVARRHGGL